MKHKLLKLRLSLVVGFIFLLSGCRDSSVPLNFLNTLDMANTVSPIITMLSESLCEYENIQYGPGPARGGKLIYKREKVGDEHGGCINDNGNAYYIRCYEWGRDENGVWYWPYKDVPVGAYSCIDETDVEIPYDDELLRTAELGKKFYR